VSTPLLLFIMSPASGQCPLLHGGRHGRWWPAMGKTGALIRFENQVDDCIDYDGYVFIYKRLIKE